ncbi:MAG: hypothetical protein VB055_01405 [Oscillospiraceae bacterium]|nr:hypothetical protein [Oscillospiraceae bacterium]
MRKFLRALSFPLTLLLLSVMLLRAAETADAAFDAMRLSATVVVPSLFPFCVLSGVLVRSGLAVRWGRRCEKLMTTLFHVDGACAAPVMLGLLCGYPIGAVALSQLYADGEISKQGAERALGFSCNASPGFLVAVAGGAILGSARAGFLLLAVQVCACLLAGLALRGRGSARVAVRKTARPVSFAAAFSAAVRDAAVTMVQVSGFIVLFSVVLSLLRPITALIPGGGAQALCAGFLEVTNGLSVCAASDCGEKFLLCAAMLGWSGLCVHFQVLSFTLPLGLSPVPYLRGKVLQSLFALLLAVPLSRFLRVPAAAFTAPSTAPSFPSFFLTAFWAFLCLIFFSHWKFRKKSGIIKENRAGGTDHAV